MTLIEAKETRDKYLKLIGTENDMGLEIVDIIAEPLGIGENFRMKYFELMRQNGQTSNDNLLLFFTADNYQVTVVLDFDGDCVNIGFDDINKYSSLI
jgi:hypothetical protein